MFSFYLCYSTDEETDTAKKKISYPQWNHQAKIGFLTFNLMRLTSLKTTKNRSVKCLNAILDVVSKKFSFVQRFFSRELIERANKLVSN